MKKIFIILGFGAAVIAVVLSVVPFFKLAFVPAVLAFIFGLLAYFKSKKEGASKHTVQLIFLLTIVALSLATYKSIFDVNEIGDIEQLEKRSEESKEAVQHELEDIDITE